MALLADRRDRAPAPLATVLLLDGDPARRRAVVARLRGAGRARRASARRAAAACARLVVADPLPASPGRPSGHRTRGRPGVGGSARYPPPPPLTREGGTPHRLQVRRSPSGDTAHTAPGGALWERW